MIDKKLNINNILVISPMYKELQIFLEKEGINKNFRYLTEDKMSDDDVNWADALVCFNLRTYVDYSRFKWVHSLGAGVDRFLFEKKWDENVLLTRTICSFGQRIAEYCLSYLLKDLQYHQEYNQNKQLKKWQPMTPKLLKEQKVMIYGTGEIGQKVAEILSGFDVEVYGVSLSGKEKEYFKEVMSINSHMSQLREMDYIINTLPLTEHTNKIFDAEIFKNASGIGFINVGRGATVNEEALLEALNNGQVRIAVLDVFEVEPLPQSHPLWNHSNVFITPHISAITPPDEGAKCLVETIRNIDSGRVLFNKADVEKGY